jgi:hypothetical protein
VHIFLKRATDNARGVKIDIRLMVRTVNTTYYDATAAKGIILKSKFIKYNVITFATTRVCRQSYLFLLGAIKDDLNC